jgi:hypothetical protein
MSRAAWTAAAALLAFAPAADAKGLNFLSPPDGTPVGAPVRFQFFVWGEPARRGGPATMIEGVHPLVTFRDMKTSRVVRVRMSRSDLGGISAGVVRLPAHGPWRTTVRAGRSITGPDEYGAFTVGTGLPHPPVGVPLRPKPVAATADDHGFRWTPFLLGGPLLALGVAVARRRRRRARLTS